MIIVSVLFILALVFKIFGPAMAIMLPLERKRKKLAWALWFTSLLGGLLETFTTLIVQNMVSALEDLDPTNDIFSEAVKNHLFGGSLTSELVLNCFPAVFAFSLWVASWPKLAQNNERRHKLILLAAVYLIPSIAWSIYISVAGKAAL
jgi:hypothetical protein